MLIAAAVASSSALVTILAMGDTPRRLFDFQLLVIHGDIIASESRRGLLPGAWPVFDEVGRVTVRAVVSAPFILPAAAGICLMIATRREKRRLEADFCPQCGYDLSVTPHRCPECGYGLRDTPS
jgi:hypothetical protein